MTEPAAPLSNPPAGDFARDDSSRGWNAPPFLVALAGWVLPGAGYWLIGQRTRGTIAGLTILLLFAAGILVGGIRVIDVPGYRDSRDPRVAYEKIVTNDGRWVLWARPMPTLLEKPWYLGQILAGPVTIVASYASVEAASRQYPKGTAHVAEFGTLYCAVAGMLNLLILLDSTSRAASGRSEE